MKRIIILLITITMLFCLVSPVYAVKKDTTAPIIKTINPSNNKINIPINQTITISFSENIQKGTAFTKINLTDSTKKVVAIITTMSKNILTIKPKNIFNYNSIYTLTIPVNTVKDTSSNSLKKAIVLKFTTAKKLISTPIPKLSVQEVAKKRNAVVYIEVSDINNNVYASGSGFIVNNKIITNYHVVDKAYYATFTISNGTKYNIISVCSYDKDKDIAILNTDLISLPSLNLGDSDKLELGESVVAIGSPLGLQNTVSVGIVSGLRYNNYKEIQISVPINHGSSGGALFNMYGDVVGITSSGYVDTTGDLNFAIPINLVKPMLNSSIDISLKEVYNNVHTIIYSDAKYEGDILNGNPNGFGVMTWNNGTIYTGNWLSGIIEGYGIMKFSFGDGYCGDWKNGKRNGQGTSTWANGDKYVGTWIEDIRNGQGTYTWANGTESTGLWANDVFVSSTTKPTTITVESVKWINENEPNNFNKDANVLPIESYINGYLFDEYDVDTYKIQVPQSGYYNIWSQIGTDGIYCDNYWVLLSDYNDVAITVAPLYTSSSDQKISNFLYNYYLNNGTYYIHVVPNKDKFVSAMKLLEYSVMFKKTE